MSTYKTDTLVLAKRSLKEADRLYVLYTKDHGKIEAKLRSAVNTKSKVAGHIEPFALSRVMIAKGKGLETIAGAKLVKNYIFPDSKVHALAIFASELVIKFLRPGLAEIKIYQLLQSFLESLASLKALSISSKDLVQLRLLTLRFIWQFLTLLGHQINPKDKKFFNLPSLSKEGQELLENCLKERQKLTILQSSSKVVEELANFTYIYICDLAESDFKSFHFTFYG